MTSTRVALLIVAMSMVVLSTEIAGADKVFGLWNLSCPKAESASCFISHAVTVYPTGGQTVLGVSVRMDGRAPTPEMMLRFSPLADAEPGIRLKVDHRAGFRLPIGLCDKKVCEARGWLRGTILKQLRSGKLAEVTFDAAGGQHTARLSLDGFTSALRELESMHAR